MVIIYKSLSSHFFICRLGIKTPAPPSHRFSGGWRTMCAKTSVKLKAADMPEGLQEGGAGIWSQLPGLNPTWLLQVGQLTSPHAPQFFIWKMGSVHLIGWGFNTMTGKSTECTHLVYRQHSVTIRQSYFLLACQVRYFEFWILKKGWLNIDNIKGRQVDKDLA